MKKVAFSKKHLLEIITAAIFLFLLMLFARWYSNSLDKFLRSKEFVYCVATVLFAIVFMGSLYIYEERDKLIRNMCSILRVVLPVLMFVLVETISDSFGTVQVENVIKNLMIYFLVYLFLIIVTGNSKITMLIYMPLFLILAMVQYFVEFFRGRPFIIQDIKSFGTAMSVAGNYSYEVPYNIFLILVTSVSILWMMMLWNYKAQKERKIGFILFTMLLMTIGIWSFGQRTFLNKIDMWYFDVAYKQDGVVLTLLEGIPYSFQDKPEGYSDEKINDIVTTIGEYDEPVSEKPNIILIMNESFSDLEYLGNIQSEEGLLPFWKELSSAENVVSGYLNMPVFGGGTANAEWEVLEGCSIQFMPVGNAPYQMNEKENVAGMASVLKEQGYVPIALHPYMAENWNRHNVYKNMGFDKFFHESNWGTDTKRIREYVSDLSVYEKIKELCEETKEPIFAFAVTMQNHASYGSTSLAEVVELQYENEYTEAENYLTLLQESDKAFQWLINAFKDEKEETMIIMFGDHQAQIESEFYEKLYGKSLESLTFEETQSRYVTPFIVWTNYDMEAEYNVRMSSNFFGSYILELSGVKLPPFNRFLLNMCEEIPIIGMGGICTKEGIWYTWDEVPQEYADWISGYKILQYNKVYDEGGYREEIFQITE